MGHYYNSIQTEPKGKGTKMYLGVSSLIGGGVFYFNLSTITTIRIVHVHKKSKSYLAYLEKCEDANKEPQKNIYFLTVGGKGQKETFLITDKKRKMIISRLKYLLFLPDDILIGDEEE